jgi:SAM-dependent methyltransferase
MGSMNTQDKLNLGAGNVILNGYVNHDLWKHRPEIDVVHDLDVLPWPWKDGFFQEVRSWAVFEHLHLTLAESVEECWRVLKPGGELRMKVPQYGSPNAAIDPTHVWRTGYLRETFEFFDPDKGKFGARGKMYGLKPWVLVSVGSTANGNAWSVRMRKRGL